MTGKHASKEKNLLTLGVVRIPLTSWHGKLFGVDEERHMEGMMSEILEQYREWMDAQAEALNRLQKELAASMASVQLSLDLSKVDWPKLHARLGQSCERLASLGWTMPMGFTAREQVDLSERGKDQQVEQYMLNHFTVEGGRNFLCLRGRVLSSANLVRWRPLLEQCFQAYDRGHCLVLIPALVSVTEGALAQIVGKLKDRRTRARGFAKDLVNTAPPDSIMFFSSRSAQVFIDNLFAGSPFDGPHPGRLNRHWILHGRDHTQWTQADALRLFNLLDTIS